MTLTELSESIEVPLATGDPSAAPDPLGEVGASPHAQACKSGVVAISLTADCAYSICHEMAHIILGFDAPHDEVFRQHRWLADKLDEPMRSMAQEGLTSNG